MPADKPSEQLPEWVVSLRQGRGTLLGLSLEALLLWIALELGDTPGSRTAIFLVGTLLLTAGALYLEVYYWRSRTALAERALDSLKKAANPMPAGHPPRTRLEVSDSMSAILLMLYRVRPSPLTERDFDSRLMIGIPDVEYSLRKLSALGFVSEPVIAKVISNTEGSWKYHILDRGVDYIKANEQS